MRERVLYSGISQEDLVKDLCDLEFDYARRVMEDDEFMGSKRSEEVRLLYVLTQLRRWISEYGLKGCFFNHKGVG